MPLNKNISSEEKAYRAYKTGLQSKILFIYFFLKFSLRESLAQADLELSL